MDKFIAYLSRICQNTLKKGPEQPSYLDSVYAVKIVKFDLLLQSFGPPSIRLRKIDGVENFQKFANLSVWYVKHFKSH